MDIKILSLGQSVRSPSHSNLNFGATFTNRMFTQTYTQGIGWTDATIGPYGPIVLPPSASIFHYGQEIFEGLKAYRRPDGNINLFRAMENMKRFNNSALRLAMPLVDEKDHFDAIVELINLEKEWVPYQTDASLYIRPVMIATDSTLGLHASHSYLHFIILCPVGPYFPGGFNTTIAVYISETYRRAVKGGTGGCKTGGNYAASLLATEEAKKMGYSQVLWLDAIHGRYIEEVGAMNICFVYEDKKIVTPPLMGSILPGITRNSILILGRDLGYEVAEELLDVSEVLEDIQSKRITEVFGCGTAAVISPIGKLGFREKDYLINEGQIGPISRHLFNELTSIQNGQIPDRFGWTYCIKD